MPEKNILIVEDETDAAKLLASFLKRKGYEVSISDNLEDAREALDADEFDHVLLDLNLPDGSGFDLMEDIKSHNPDTKIIVNSAFDDEEERNRAREMGVSDFLSKPTDFTKITQVL